VWDGVKKACMKYGIMVSNTATARTELLYRIIVEYFILDFEIVVDD